MPRTSITSAKFEVRISDRRVALIDAKDFECAKAYSARMYGPAAIVLPVFSENKQ